MFHLNTMQEIMDAHYVLTKNIIRSSQLCVENLSVTLWSSPLAEVTWCRNKWQWGEVAEKETPAPITRQCAIKMILQLLLQGPIVRKPSLLQSISSILHQLSWCFWHHKNKKVLQAHSVSNKTGCVHFYGLRFLIGIHQPPLMACCVEIMNI